MTSLLDQLGVVGMVVVLSNGLGRLIFQSIANRDLPSVQALVMLFAAIVVTANFIVDLLYLVIDPRLKTRS